jgi:outer membrane lipopolysaccharide assembly protein LptE/RlpB
MRIPFLLPLAALVLSGCAGYHLGPVKPKRMADIQSIAVPSFRNETLQTRVEVPLANALIKQFQQDGTYKIARENDADAVLHGTLDQIVRSPARSVTGNVLLTREYNLTLRCTYKVVKRSTGAILDQRTAFGQTSFFVSGSDAIAADVTQDERQALPLAAEDLAVRIVSQLSEGW